MGANRVGVRHFTKKGAPIKHLPPTSGSAAAPATDLMSIFPIVSAVVLIGLTGALYSSGALEDLNIMNVAAKQTKKTKKELDSLKSAVPFVSHEEESATGEDIVNATEVLEATEDSDGMSCSSCLPHCVLSRIIMLLSHHCFLL